VGSVFEEQKVFDVIVQGVPETHRSVASVRSLLIDKPDGGHVRLGEVADVRVAQTPIAIQREAVSRYLDIEADVSGRSVDAVAADIEDRLANVTFPLEFHAEVLQKTTGEEINGGRILAFAGAAAIAIFLLLQAAFRSWRLAVVTFVALPVALVGGVVAALIDGAELSLGSMLAFLALYGLAARHSVVLVRRLQELELQKGEASLALVERGARERLGPVLTSLAASALVMLPFVIAGDIPGLEIVHPMAIVILGGLFSTTLLSLFVLPGLYLRFGAGTRPRVSPEEEIMHRLAGIEPVPAGTAANAAGGPEGNGEGIRERPPAV
jgi:Cu/Ag efflux pump CusA